MTITQYQEQAARTINRDLSQMQATRHALFGLCAEVGEVQGLFQKHYQGHPLSYVELRKEIGDVCWMIAELCTVHGWSMEDICQENIAKLKKRYPEGFDADRSIHREE